MSQIDDEVARTVRFTNVRVHRDDLSGKVHVDAGIEALEDILSLSPDAVERL